MMSCSGSCHNHINFTTRGKLLLIDVEKAKRDEFNRRRKLRLQQVRQQSNIIAKEIRDKVKTEKLIKDSQEELRKHAQYNKWHEVQMRTLQEEFNRRAIIAEQDKENALKETELALLEKERQQVLNDIAKKRGNLAVLKQRREKLSVETESFLKTNNAKFNRSLENLRSALVASLPKPCLKNSTDQKSNFDQKLISGGTDSPDYTEEPQYDKHSSDELGVNNSVMSIISGDDQSIRKSCSKSANDKNIYGSWQSSSSQRSSRLCESSPDRYSRPRSVSRSPGRKHFTNHNFSPRKFNSEVWSYTSETVQPVKSSPADFELGTKISPHRKSKIHSDCDKQFCYSDKSHVKCSPKKRLASNVLMSPSKRVAMPAKCNHSKDTSPSRCTESYSPNVYKAEMGSDINRCRPRQVRFQNITSPNGTDYVQFSPRRSRTVSEGDSEMSFESDVTWPPRKWDCHQDEEVILYDHCGRSVSKYLPKHRVSVISNQSGDDGLEEEMEACRERALRRHEETLRKRRGCRALYRQRLRAEFSCMISDLARLDKHTRLAKLESEAKAALISKKSQKTSGTKNYKGDSRPEKDDLPGTVHVMECIDPVGDIAKTAETNTVMAHETILDCDVDALDQLLIRLKEQRDHLLACQQVGEHSKSDKFMQSASVQCNGPPSTDIATSPRETSPYREVETQVEAKQSRATSPIEYAFQPSGTIKAKTCETSDPSSSPVLVEDSPKHTVPPLDNKPTKNNKKTISYKEASDKSLDGKVDKSGNHLQISTNNEISSEEKNAAILNLSELASPCNVGNGSSSSDFVDASAYSFDGVKVEVKVTKNKAKKLHQNKDSISKKYSKKTEETAGVFYENDSWARKLIENNSSSTGTSYMSPPDELNPAEHKLLISVLEGMDKKNNNPILRTYIQKLLSMSKESLENMSISISDDSMRSDIFKSCNDNSFGYATHNELSQSSFLTAPNYEGSKTISESCPKSKKQLYTTDRRKEPVKIILESDEASTFTKDASIPSAEPKLIENFSSRSQYVSALSQCNDRLKKLTKIMSEEVCVSNNSFLENDTSYLAVASDLSGSVKLTTSVQESGLFRPEASNNTPNACEETGSISTAPLASAGSWGLRVNLLPHPELSPEKPTDRRMKPPSTLFNYNSRKMMLESVAAHELSTIVEAESKFSSSLLATTKQQSSSGHPQSIKKILGSVEDKNSDDESYHTLPAAMFPISSESSVLSSVEVSPPKPTDDSSLQILTELPDSSFGQSSAEEVAVSEVFRSLGIGWALSTWRKTYESSRKDQESSSSPSDAVTLKKRTDEFRYRHSTPIKTSDAEKNNKMVEGDDDRLTPPSVTLYQRYQNLIRSASDISESNGS